jgi:hypothetical protein
MLSHSPFIIEFEVICKAYRQNLHKDSLSTFSACNVLHNPEQQLLVNRNWDNLNGYLYSLSTSWSCSVLHSPLRRLLINGYRGNVSISWAWNVLHSLDNRHLLFYSGTVPLLPWLTVIYTVLDNNHRSQHTRSGDPCNSLACSPIQYVTLC